MLFYSNGADNNKLSRSKATLHNIAPGLVPAAAAAAAAADDDDDDDSARLQ